MKYTLFNITTGELTRTMECSNFVMEAQNLQNEKYLIGDWIPSYLFYVPDPLNPVVTNRPDNNIILDKVTLLADGTDKAILTNVQVGSTITLRDTSNMSLVTSGIATTPTVDLVFDIVGTYNLKVELFPYLPFETTIDAT